VREALPIVRQVIGSALWLIEQAWHLGFSFAAGIAAAWPHAQPWQQISFLALIALDAYVAFMVSRSVLKGVRYIVNVLACLTVLLMTIVPTVVVTFLALAGAIWIAKSFS
jgi:hypothetical protein